MQLTSCLIGGNELISYLLVTPTRITYESGDRIGGAHLELFGVPNEIGILIEPGLDVEIWTGNSNPGAGLFASTTFGGALFGSGATTNRLFIGRISRVDAQAKRLAKNGAGYTVFGLDCQDLMTTLAETFVEEDIVFPAGSDLDLIETVFSTYAPSISLDGCVEVEADLEMTVRAGWSLREFMNQVCARTSAQFNLAAANLSYAPIGEVSAPFAVREFEGTDTLTAGDGLFGSTLFGSVVFGGGSEGTTIPARMVLFDGHRYIEEWTQPCNSVVVKGKAGSGGVRVTSGTVTDSASITRYGTRSQCITDNNIQTADEAILRANAHLEQFANPQKSCSFSTFDEGLAVGQTISIVMPSLRMDCSLYINRASIAWITQTTVKSSFDAGFYRPTSAQIAKQNADAGKPTPYVPLTIPADGTVTNAKIVGPITADLIDTINATQIDGLIQAAQINTITFAQITGTVTVNAANISGLIQASQIDTINASDIVGSISASQIGSVNVGTLVGNIIGSQIDNLTITDGNIANSTISSAKIASLDVAKLTSGTITAAIAISSGGSLTVAGPADFNNTTTVTGSLIASGGIQATSGVFSSTLNAQAGLQVNGNSSISNTNQFIGGGGVSTLGVVQSSSAFNHNGNSGGSGTITLAGLTSITVSGGLVISWT
jgi:hypothetical protein